MIASTERVVLASPDGDPLARPNYPATANDVLHLLSNYIADRFSPSIVPGDSFFAGWEQQARPVVEALVADRDRLEAEVAEWKASHEHRMDRIDRLEDQVSGYMLEIATLTARVEVAERRTDG